MCGGGGQYGKGRTHLDYIMGKLVLTYPLDNRKSLNAFEQGKRKTVKFLKGHFNTTVENRTHCGGNLRQGE